MAMGAPAGEESSFISFHRMHYGKLAEGEERRIPASAGYAVTRRSRGLGQEWDPYLSPLSLTGLRRFEPDAIDVDSRAGGCLVARALGESIVLMRARFRPEDGERGFGRLHQQAAIWVGAMDAFRAHPAASLALAAQELRALPDLAQEPETKRLNDPPLSWRVVRLDPDGVRAAVERSDWGVPMLELLLDGAETGADATRDFGAHDFESEAAFLAAVGLTLQILPRAFPRWRDISVVSGLAHALPGLCLRYVPSWGRARAAA